MGLTLVREDWVGRTSSVPVVMIVRCREQNLRMNIPENEARELIVVVLTMQVMQVLRTGYHRIPL